MAIPAHLLEGLGHGDGVVAADGHALVPAAAVAGGQLGDAVLAGGGVGGAEALEELAQRDVAGDVVGAEGRRHAGGDAPRRRPRPDHVHLGVLRREHQVVPRLAPDPARRVPHHRRRVVRVVGRRRVREPLSAALLAREERHRVGEPVVRRCALAVERERGLWSAGET